MQAYVVILFLAVSSCDISNRRPCHFVEGSADNTNVLPDRCFCKLDENGPWVVSDSTGSVVKKGTYSKGLHIGPWTYSFANQPEYSINWVEFINDSLGIRTNIPIDFDQVDIQDKNIVFSMSDTAKKIKLLISVEDSINLPFGVSELYLQTEEDVTQLGWSIERYSDLINDDGSVVYVNWYKLNRAEELRYILEAYGHAGDGKLVWIICNYDLRNDNLGRLSFTSITPHIFIKGRRLFYPYFKVSR